MAKKNVLKTHHHHHPNFKSLVPGITNLNEIKEECLKLFEDQYTTYHREGPVGGDDDVSSWDSFEIEMEKIDRLYRYYHNEKDNTYRISVRVVDSNNEKHPRLYVDIIIIKNLLNTNINPGLIQIYLDPILFLRLFVNDDEKKGGGFKKELVYESLKEEEEGIICL